jgi:hypothetical protein
LVRCSLRAWSSWEVARWQKLAMTLNWHAKFCIGFGRSLIINVCHPRSVYSLWLRRQESITSRPRISNQCLAICFRNIQALSSSSRHLSFKNDMQTQW